jgi:hypothetical protein
MSDPVPGLNSTNVRNQGAQLVLFDHPALMVREARRPS